MRREGGSHGAITNLSHQTGWLWMLHHIIFLCFKLIYIWISEETGASPLSPESVKAAAKSGLSAAATKAKLFADHEEREIQRLTAAIINHQVQLLHNLQMQLVVLACFMVLTTALVFPSPKFFFSKDLLICQTGRII